MPGYRHSPLDDISRIRQDLRDRYQDGFPILKELLQNADDAGASEPGAAATQLVLVLAKNGLHDASHPLLQTAGVAVLNDGAFTPSDAISITSLGRSNKAGQVGSAGKFGLGLKSIFHWAEALFYFSPNRFGGHDPDQASPCDLLNPWWSRETRQGRHSDWEEAWDRCREADLAAFARIAKQALAGERWFGLWIPLRRPEHLRNGDQEVKPIEHQTPSADLTDLLGKHWERRVVETMPLLRRLRMVRVVELNNGELIERAIFSVAGSAQRMRFGLNGVVNIPGTHPLSGTVQTDAIPGSALAFAGIEQVTDMPLLQEIRHLPKWPVQTAIGPDDADLQLLEKAEPHAAVVLSRQSAGSKGSVRLQSAVFLPLGEPEEIECSGCGCYSLNLHGFFFVDSGRRAIQPFDGLPEDLQPREAQTEMQVIQLWNRTLMREVVAPLVLLSLDTFVKQEQVDFEEAEALVAALRKAETVKRLMPWMCKGQRFLTRLRQSGFSCERQILEGMESPWIALPAPGFAESELFDLMPRLAAFSEECTLSVRGRPCLAADSPRKLKTGELAGLLASVGVQVFQNAAHLGYLTSLVKECVGGDSADCAVTGSLVRLANHALVRTLPEEAELRQAWKNFFELLPNEVVLVLPCDSTDVAPDIAASLQNAELPVALQWQDFRSGEGAAVIPWPMLAPCLESLGSLDMADAAAVEQRSKIAVRLLEACSDDGDHWPADLDQWPLFAARQPDEDAEPASLARLKQSQAAGLLFAGGASWARNLLAAARELRPLLVASPVVQATGLEAGCCDAAACVRALQQARELDPAFGKRRPLFQELLDDTGPADGERWKALRCLIHGQNGEWNNPAVLLLQPEQPDAFAKLVALALSAATQPWRLIPWQIGSQLGLDAVQMQRLAIRHVSAVETQALVRAIGPEKVDCATLTTEDCDRILLDFDDVGVLRALNIHETPDGRRVRIQGHTYVEDGEFGELPPAFDHLVTRIRHRIGYERFENDGSAHRLVSRLNWEAVIEIATARPERVKWWETILTAIGHLNYVRVDLRDRLRQVAWLPLAEGGGAAPADLLHVTGIEAELNRLPQYVLNGSIPVLRLSASFTNHDLFGSFVTRVLPRAEDAVAMLAEALAPHPVWSTGLGGDWSSDQISDWIDVLGNPPDGVLLAAPLLKAFHDIAPLHDLLPGVLGKLAGNLEAPAYAAVLAHLSGQHPDADQDRRHTIESVFRRYLERIDTAGVGFSQAVLGMDGVRLLNEAGDWKAPRELAPPTGGLRNRCVLDSSLAAVMPVLTEACRGDNELGAAAEAFHDPGSWGAMAQQLRTLLEPWRQFLPSPDPIGALLSLLTSPGPVGNLAGDFFNTHGRESVVAWFNEHHPNLLHNLQHALSHPVPVIMILSERTVWVRSLLGTGFAAERALTPDRLIFAGDPSTARGGAVLVNGALQPGPIRRVLRFLPMDPSTGSVPHAIERLRQAGEQIIHRCTGQQVDLSALFQGLCETAQVELQVAQSLVVESALAVLRQIGGHADQGVRQALAAWDTAQQAEAEAEALRLHTRRQQAEEWRRKAKSAIRDLLRDDSSAQAALLGEVRRKLAQYQYDTTSIPFELWQNADDAACELGILGPQAPTHESDLFAMALRGNALEVAHFGRLINQHRLPGGETREDFGFKRDLEKMVVQSISDKADSTRQGDAPLTGKFGLGFKSVFLVSDAPEVLSGSLDFTIRGGIYPVRLNSEVRGALVEGLRRLAPERWRRGTIIRLPFPAGFDMSPDRIAGVFRRLAPLLVVFSRKLKRLRIHDADEVGEDEREHTWRPDPVVEGVVAGKLSALGDELQGALILDAPTGHDRLQLLLGLGPNGICPLPEDVPAFWVTTPTRDTPDYGFAVNGPFEPDVGRVQLALKSTRNEQLADELARVLPVRLGRVDECACQAWEVLRHRLRLGPPSTRLALWESVWLVLGKRFAERCPASDTSTGAVLARRILWGLKATGLRRFYMECATLPTGLWGDHQTLTRLGDIRFEAAGALDRQNVFMVVSQWLAFRRSVLPTQIVSGTNVASVLRRWRAIPDEVEAIHLATVTEWELQQDDALRADAETASRLGRLITSDFLRSLKEGQPGVREESEHRALSGTLPRVLFQAADGAWFKSSALVVAEGQDVDADERMRAAFAPPEARLHPTYTGPALAFFLASRPRLEADVETMFKWMRDASDDVRRAAAMQYLLHGDMAMRHRLSAKAREAIQAGCGGWLASVEDQAWFQEACGDEDRQELAVHMLRTRSPDGPPAQPQPQPPQAPMETWRLQDLLAWWRCEHRHAADYTLDGRNWDLMVPDRGCSDLADRVGVLRGRLRDPDSPDGKVTWYRLFGLACLMAVGRTTSELRGFWSSQLEGEGKFWRSTSQQRFPEAAEQVFDRLCDRRFTHVHASSEWAYYWRRLFYDVRKMHRLVWEYGFPAMILEQAEKAQSGQQLIEFIRSGHLPGQAQWVGVVGQSIGSPLFFIIRELRRLRIIENPAVDSAAFFPSRHVRRAAASIGWLNQGDIAVWKIEDLLRVSAGLDGRVRHMPELAKHYDIPLLHMGVTCQPLPPPRPSREP